MWKSGTLVVLALVALALQSEALNIHKLKNGLSATDTSSSANAAAASNSVASGGTTAQQSQVASAASGAASASATASTSASTASSASGATSASAAASTSASGATSASAAPPAPTPTGQPQQTTTPKLVEPHYTPSVLGLINNEAAVVKVIPRSDWGAVVYPLVKNTDGTVSPPTRIPGSLPASKVTQPAAKMAPLPVAPTSVVTAVLHNPPVSFIELDRQVGSFVTVDELLKDSLVRALLEGKESKDLSDAPTKAIKRLEEEHEERLIMNGQRQSVSSVLSQVSGSLARFEHEYGNPNKVVV